MTLNRKKRGFSESYLNPCLTVLEEKQLTIFVTVTARAELK